MHQTQTLINMSNVKLVLKVKITLTAEGHTLPIRGAPSNKGIYTDHCQ